MSKLEGITGADYIEYYKTLYLTTENFSQPIERIVLGDKIYLLTDEKPVNELPPLTTYVRGNKPSQAELEDIFRGEEE